MSSALVDELDAAVVLKGDSGLAANDGVLSDEEAGLGGAGSGATDIAVVNPQEVTESELDSAAAAANSSGGGGRQRKYGDEDPSNPAWIKHKKHFFILSSSGKPIYTKYGDESKLSTLMGIIQAMVSFLQGEQDTIKSISAGGHLFVFVLKGPIYLVAVSQTGESDVHLRDQLTYLHSHLISVLTLAQITRIFQQRVSYDLRNLLSTSDNVCLDNLTREVERNPSFLLGAIQCLRLPPNVRSSVGQIIHQARTSSLLYAILFVGNKMVTLVRPRRHSLHPFDLHLLFNIVNSSNSFRQALGSWMPVCLPKFNSKGFLYVHISYLEQTDLCLMLVSNDKDKFFELSEARDKINNSFIEQGLLKHMVNAAEQGDYSLGDIGIAGLRHFMYMSRSTMQYATCRWEAPYMDRKDRLRVTRLYQHMHHRAHVRARTRKIHYMVGKTEVVIGWIAPGFELYVVFGPLIIKNNVISALNSLIRLIKRDEEHLFTLNPPVF